MTLATFKKHILKFTKITVIVFVVLLLLSGLGLFAISYKVVDALTLRTNKTIQTTENRNENPSPPVASSETGKNEVQTTPRPPEQNKNRWSEQEFANFLDRTAKLEAIQRESPESLSIDVCNILCNESRFDTSNSDILVSLLQFYEQEGPRAFEDPRFNIGWNLFEARVLSVMTPSTRNFLIEIRQVLSQHDEISTFEKARLAVWAQKGILESIMTMKKNIPLSKERLRKLEHLIDLRHQCDSISRSEIYKQCQSIE